MNIILISFACMKSECYKRLNGHLPLLEVWLNFSENSLVLIEQLMVILILPTLCKIVYILP